LEDLTYVI